MEGVVVKYMYLRCLRVTFKDVFGCPFSQPPHSFFSCTLFKLLNGMFFKKKFYTKVTLKNQINLFLLKKLILN